MTMTTADIKVFLSGGAANADPDASLGGAMSSVEVDLVTLLNNLFDNVTGTEATDGVTRYRCVYVQNVSADANGWIDPVCWISKQPQAPDSPYTVTGETLSFGFHDTKNEAAELVADENTAPADIVFSTVSTVGTGVALPSPDYTEDDYIGLWLKIVTPSSQPMAVGTVWQVSIEGDIVPTA